MNKQIALTIAAVLVVGVGAFFGGQAYAKGRSNPAFNGRPGAGQFRNANGASGTPGANFRGGMNVGAVNGEILSKDDKSITVKLADGGSKIVFVSESTTVSKTEAGSLSDLETGKQVTVFGKTNDDGSVTAQNVQLRPEGMMMRPGMPGQNGEQPQK